MREKRRAGKSNKVINATKRTRHMIVFVFFNAKRFCAESQVKLYRTILKLMYGNNSSIWGTKLNVHKLFLNCKRRDLEPKCSFSKKEKKPQYCFGLVEVSMLRYDRVVLCGIGVGGGGAAY